MYHRERRIVRESFLPDRHQRREGFHFARTLRRGRLSRAHHARPRVAEHRNTITPSKSTDDISVIVLFFHVSRHNRTNDAYVGALDEQQFAQSDDEPVDSDAEPPLQRLARSHSEVSMSLYLSRQSQRDSAARASVREMFTRTPEEILEMRLPSVGWEGASMVVEGKSSVA